MIQEWERCKPWIEAALATSPGLETIEDVERLLNEGHYTLWSSDNAAAIVEIAEYCRKKVAVVVHGGGDMSELLDAVEPQVCAFAKLAGCTMVMGTGRLGWKPITEKRGYKLAFITMYKEI